MKSFAGSVAVVLVLAAAAVKAEERRAIQWHVNAGYSFTSSTTADYLDDGWTLGFGASWRPDPDGPFAVRADIHYSAYDGTSELVQTAEAAGRVQVDDGDADIWGINFNGVYDVEFSPRVRGYGTAGLGWYYREVELQQTVLVGGVFCDPWWGFCYPGVTTGQAVVDETSTTRFAWNVGVGVEFPLQDGSAWFIDARYHRIETSEPTEFIPIQVGYRF